MGSLPAAKVPGGNSGSAAEIAIGNSKVGFASGFFLGCTGGVGVGVGTFGVGKLGVGEAMGGFGSGFRGSGVGDLGGEGTFSSSGGCGDFDFGASIIFGSSSAEGCRDGGLRLGVFGCGGGFAASLGLTSGGSSGISSFATVLT